jgi:hypothetical protein
MAVVALGAAIVAFAGRRSFLAERTLFHAREEQTCLTHALDLQQRVDRFGEHGPEPESRRALLEPIKREAEAWSQKAAWHGRKSADYGSRWW